MTIESEILRVMRAKDYRPMKANELERKLRVKDGDKQQFRETLRQMELGGQIVEVKQKRLALPDKVHLTVGVLRVNPRGFGFVVPKAAEDKEDLFVRQGDMSTALDGDTVAVREVRPEPPQGPAGKIVSIIERGRKEIVGTFNTTKSFSFCVPDNPSVLHNIYIGPQDKHGATPGDKVVVKITEWPSRHSAPEGKVIEVLGQAGEQKVDLMAVVRGYGLPDKFNPETMAEARSLGRKVAEKDTQGRRDLTDMFTITIDPVDARDFDDAISLAPEKGGWRLFVHIADVSHYVKAASALDGEARKRGTSVYLPGSVIPMLPKSLSNGLCSLKPRQVRLTKTVEVLCDQRGFIADVSIYRSVIRSDHRLTYGEVLDMIEGRKSDDRKLTEFVKQSNKLAQKLKENRRSRGMLGLDIAKSAVRIDENGDVEEIYLEESDAAHGLIEQFMLTANETVAEFLSNNKLPGIFRIHDQPSDESFAEVAKVVRAMGYKTGSVTDVKSLQRLLDKTRDTPDGKLFHLAILRTFAHAIYTHRPGLHFALATSHYLHYTSPIRRYPDLIVHRVLDDHFDGNLKSAKQRKEYDKDFGPCAAHCSDTEQRAEKAERELVKLKILEYLEKHRRSVYKGLITGFKEHGVQVEVENIGIPGFVRLSSLTDDFYELDRKGTSIVGRASKRRFKLGEEVKVKIDQIDMIKRQADFAFVDDKKS